MLVSAGKFTENISTEKETFHFVNCMHLNFSNQIRIEHLNKKTCYFTYAYKLFLSTPREKINSRDNIVPQGKHVSCNALTH